MRSSKQIWIVVMAAVLLLCCGISGDAAWKDTSTGRKYVMSSGEYAKSRWLKIKNKWYYFDKSGRLKTGKIKVGKDYYYVKRSTGRVCRKRIGTSYYGADGKMVCNTWQKVGKYLFYFDRKGKVCCGRVKVDGEYYYCHKTTGKVISKSVGSYYYDKNGVMVKNRWVKKFYYGKDGKKKIGKFTAADGKTYYCDTTEGKITSRWVNGNYYDKNGVMAVNCWIDKSYVNEKGVITKGEKHPKNPPTEAEIRWLSAIVYLEAGNQSYYGKKCVASVVMNRVNSKRFPNTIKKVLFQSGQFTPAGNGSLSRLYNSKKKIQEQSVKAAKYVLEHGSILKGYYYFNTYSGTLKIGEHYFG